MENKVEDLETLETLSLSDLQMNEGNESYTQSPTNSSSSPRDFFEFLINESSEYENNTTTFEDIIFCGKKINHDHNDEKKEEEFNEYVSPLFRSNSFHRPVIMPITEKRANSARFYSSQHVQKVNISALTSMSEKSRRRMFMFGPVKFKPEMELSALKKRQGRCPPPTKFPVIQTSDGGETTTMVKSSQKNNGGPIAKIRGLKCRPHFINVLAKSFGCFSMKKLFIALPEHLI